MRDTVRQLRHHKMMSGDDALWLVKSSGRILGPFATSEVTEMLRSREVSVLDEISPPLYRWQTIQYHPLFKEIIDRLRKNSLADTNDVTWSGVSQTATGNLTQTLTDNITSEVSDELTDDLSAHIAAAKEIVVHNLREDTAPSSSGSGARFQPKQAQGAAVRQKVDKSTRALWAVTVMVILVVGAFVLQKRMGTEGESRVVVTNVKQTVQSYVRSGQYEEALKLLKVQFPDPLQSGDLAIYFGSLLIQLEGQTTVGRRILNHVIVNRRSEVKQAYTGLGIADILDGQLESAQENFDRASAIDASYTPAVSNAAVVELLRGNYVRAKALATRALQLNPAQAEALLTLAQAQLQLSKNKNTVTNLTQVNNMIRDYLAKNWDFAFELGLYGLYFDFLREQKFYEERLRTYLDQDPELTSEHRHNVFVYRGHTQWKVLGRFCEQLAEGMGSSPGVSTLLASCMANEKRWDSARKFIERAVQQSAQDGLAQSWFSFILKESGDADQASVVLARANEFNRRGEFVLPNLLQARFCQSKRDFACAKDNWSKIYERNMDSLPAIAGLALVQVERSARTDAQKLIERGLKLSPDYIPLLMLRQRAEREGWYVN